MWPNSSSMESQVYILKWLTSYHHPAYNFPMHDNKSQTKVIINLDWFSVFFFFYRHPLLLPLEWCAVTSSLGNLLSFTLTPGLCFCNIVISLPHLTSQGSSDIAFSEMCALVALAVELTPRPILWLSCFDSCLESIPGDAVRLFEGLWSVCPVQWMLMRGKAFYIILCCFSAPGTY